MNDDNDNDFPKNATIREEYVRCGNPASQKCNLVGYGNDQQEQRFHGPTSIVI
ncbi:MAG: hypothetical protein WCF23_07985 [Candidatus Nitrosopolaris sp.]